MSGKAMLEAYVEAFNRGESAAYSAFYAPDVVLINGAGKELHGAESIVQFYARIKLQMQRTMTILGVVEGASTIAAALQSHFTVIADDTRFAGRTLATGDKVLLRSIALYELENGLFARIRATTLSRDVQPEGSAA